MNIGKFVTSFIFVFGLFLGNTVYAEEILTDTGDFQQTAPGFQTGAPDRNPDHSFEAPEVQIEEAPVKEQMVETKPVEAVKPAENQPVNNSQATAVEPAAASNSVETETAKESVEEEADTEEIAEEETTTEEIEVPVMGETTKHSEIRDILIRTFAILATIVILMAALFIREFKALKIRRFNTIKIENTEIAASAVKAAMAHEAEQKEQEVAQENIDAQFETFSNIQKKTTSLSAKDLHKPLI